MALADMSMGGKEIHAHGQRISIRHCEIPLIDQLGGGKVSETFVIVDGRLIEASTDPVCDDSVVITQQLDNKDGVIYGLYHPINIGQTRFLADLREPGAVLTLTLNAFDKVPFFMRKLMSKVLKYPIRVEHCLTGVTTSVGEVTSSTDVIIQQRFLVKN